MLLLAVFVMGTWLGPLLHLGVTASASHDALCGHCESDRPSSPEHPPTRHDPSSCAICKFAATGFVLSAPVLRPEVFHQIEGHLPLITTATAPRGAHALPFSCGPPA